MMLQVTRLTEELLKSKKLLVRTEDRLAEAQGLKRFDPRMSFQPKPDKENSMVSRDLNFYIQIVSSEIYRYIM